MTYKNFRALLFGSAFALGLTSIAATAQDANPTAAPVSSPTADNGSSKGGMGMMMDPEMRRQMMAMMQNCNRMMAHMGDMQRPKAPLAQPHQKQ